MNYFSFYKDIFNHFYHMAFHVQPSVSIKIILGSKLNLLSNIFLSTKLNIFPNTFFSTKLNQLPNIFLGTKVS